MSKDPKIVCLQTVTAVSYTGDRLVHVHLVHFIEGPSGNATFRWFKVRFVRTGIEVACRDIVEVPLLL